MPPARSPSEGEVPPGAPLSQPRALCQDGPMATAYICSTCGAQYPPAAEPPAGCAICLDERQYVGWGGQEWTTLEELRADQRADIRTEEPGLTGIGSRPGFAIGQRALLVETDEGNVLWDCLAPF